MFKFLCELFSFSSLPWLTNEKARVLDMFTLASGTTGRGSKAISFSKRESALFTIRWFNKKFFWFNRSFYMLQVISNFFLFDAQFC